MFQGDIFGVLIFIVSHIVYSSPTMRYFFGAHSHEFLERIGGVDSALLSLFLPSGQALRKFGGVDEAETSRGGPVLGKWLGDHKEQHARG